jgi:hypothetical protein
VNTTLAQDYCGGRRLACRRQTLGGRAGRPVSSPRHNFLGHVPFPTVRPQSTQEWTVCQRAKALIRGQGCSGKSKGLGERGICAQGTPRLWPGHRPRNDARAKRGSVRRPTKFGTGPDCCWATRRIVIAVIVLRAENALDPVPPRRATASCFESNGPLSTAPLVPANNGTNGSALERTGTFLLNPTVCSSPKSMSLLISILHS